MQQVSQSLSQLPGLFGNSSLRYMAEAIAIGNSPGMTWIDDPAHPRFAVTWDGAHCLYFAGECNSDFIQAAGVLMETSVLPQAQARKLEILKVYYMADQGWQQPLETLLQPYAPRRGQRALYMLSASPHDGHAPVLPGGFSLRRIDAALLQDQKREHIEAVIEEIESCWVSVERFLQEGFGYTAINAVGDAVGWCTAEYVSPGKCGAGVETVEEFQGRGIGTATAAAFTQEALSRGWQICWDTWLRNAPSVRIAEKLGFQKIDEYSVFLVLLN